MFCFSVFIKHFPHILSESQLIYFYCFSTPTSHRWYIIIYGHLFDSFSAADIVEFWFWPFQHLLILIPAYVLGMHLSAASQYHSWDESRHLQPQHQLLVIQLYDNFIALCSFGKESASVSAPAKPMSMSLHRDALGELRLSVRSDIYYWLL